MWRVNTSNTQARQIHFSSCVTDSGGNADKSSGSEPSFARAAVFPTATLDTVVDALFGERFAGLTEFLADRFFTAFPARLALVGIFTTISTQGIGCE